MKRTLSSRPAAGAAVVVGAAVAAVLAAMPALAHVTVQPTESTTGAFARFVVRVPNEHDTAATVKVEVQMPAELGEVRYQPKAGWRRTVDGRTVVWEGGRIEVGEFDEFGFSTRMPDRAASLAFPSVQTYENGEAVNWTGPADADKPAGRVEVRRAAGGGHGAEGAAAERGSDEEGGDSSESGLSYVAFGLGGLGAVLGLVALLRSGSQP